MTDYNTYQVLKQMAENMVQINKSITPSEWDDARCRITKLRAEGRRLDGAPANASIYGVMRRPAPTAEEQERAARKAELLAELAAYKRGAGSDDTGSNAEADDRRKPEENAGEAGTQAVADGVCEEASGRDRKRGHTDRGGAAQAGRRRGPGESGEPPRERLRAKYPSLDAEGQKEMYKEYASTPITIAELAAKWGIGEKTVRRYIYNARMQAGREENKPKRSKKSHNLTDDQIRECGRRRENGERTADLAAEMGVSRHVLKAEILRVYGRTRASKSVLTPELRAELIACYKRGDRTREIVQRYHISSHTLTEVLVDAGIAMRDGHPRRGIMTHEVAARIEFPRLAKWLEDNDMGLVGLAAYLDTPLPRLRRWLLAGDGEFITKGTIDGLLELTELGYDELFARGSRE